jgi:hypothetical protein
MTLAAVADSADARLPRLAPLAAQALRALTWRQLLGAMLFGLVVTVSNLLTFFTTTFRIGTPAFFVGHMVSDQILALCLLASIVVADRAVDAGWPRRKTYVFAALAGCLLGVALAEPWNWAWRAAMLPAQWGGVHRPWLQGTAALIYLPIFTLTHWLLIAATAVFLYAGRRAARQTAARLHAAELDRTRRSRIALESRLQAMQARIEPQFLFNTLAQVQRLYETDAALGGRMLDDLIAYLRAAMPLMRDSSSTVAQEVELARAYLDIVRLRLADRLQVDIDVPAGGDRMRMPPMMLLPLIDHAIVRGLEPGTGAGAIRVRLQAGAGRLRVTIVDSGAGFLPEAGGDGIAALRERLAALYGDRASLDLRRGGDAGTTQAVLELPLEARESADGLQAAPIPGVAT